MHTNFEPILSVAAAIIAWLIVAMLLRQLRQYLLLSQRTVRLILASFFTASVANTVYIAEIGVALDQALGINNLSWLLFVIGFAISGYCSSSANHLLLDQTVPRWYQPLLAATCLISFALFVPLSQQPEATLATAPKTYWAAVFMGVGLLVPMLMGGRDFMVLRPIIYQETDWILSTRWFSLPIIWVASFIFFLTKIVISATYTLDHPSTIYVAVTTLQTVCQGATILALIYLLQPQKSVTVLAAIRQWHTLRYLAILRSRLQQAYLPIWEMERIDLRARFVPIEITVEQYRQVSGIEDGKKQLLDFIKLYDQDPKQRVLTPPIDWQSKQTELRALAATLAQTPGSVSFNELVADYCVVGKRLANNEL